MLKGAVEPTGRRFEYDDLNDDAGSVISDICAVLADSGVASFRVEGFGDASWPVDVRTDLAVAVEQLPAAISALREGCATELDFFEQGVERRIVFEPADGGDVAGLCESMTDWRPSPDSILINRTTLVTMLQEFLDEFVSIARMACPSLAVHPLIRNWMKV